MSAERRTEKRFDKAISEHDRRNAQSLLDKHRAEVGKCESCETPLGIRGGMGGTGLCGPCCTGESETLEEFGESW